MTPHVRLSVGCLVGRSISRSAIISNFTSHAPIGVLVSSEHFNFTYKVYENWFSRKINTYYSNNTVRYSSKSLSNVHCTSFWSFPLTLFLLLLFLFHLFSLSLYLSLFLSLSFFFSLSLSHLSLSIRRRSPSSCSSSSGRPAKPSSRCRPQA